MTSSPRSSGIVTDERLGSLWRAAAVLARAGRRARGHCRRRRGLPAPAARARARRAPRSPPSRRRGRRRSSRRPRARRAASNASPSTRLRPLVEAGLGDVAPPGRAPLGVALDRQHVPAEDAHAGGEPDRRVAARAAELEHLAPGLRRHEGEQEPPGRRRDLPRAPLGREASLRAPPRPPASSRLRTRTTWSSSTRRL